MRVVHVDDPQGARAATAVLAAHARVAPQATSGEPMVEAVDDIPTALARVEAGDGQVLAVVPLESSHDGLVVATVDGLAFGTDDCLVVAEADVVDDGVTTRWVGVSTAPPLLPPDPQTLLFVIPQLNRPGTLLELLAAFSSRGLNLTRFATRPLHGMIGMYGFLLEVEGAPTDDWMRDALADVLPASSHLKFLGTFAAGERYWSEVTGRQPAGRNVRTVSDVDDLAERLGGDGRGATS